MPKQFPFRAVFFDAVGTLIHPYPSFVDVYAEVSRRFGSRLEPEAILRAFRAAFTRQEQLDRDASWRTSETREIARWRSIVGEALHDATDKEECFNALYEHFRQPRHWRCDPATEEVFAVLRQHGIELGLASNFDRRLRHVIAGFPVLAGLRNVVISSEVGWRKPAAEFFAAVLATVNATSDAILYIGDDPMNDYHGAVAAGVRAVLFDPAGRASPECHTIFDLREIAEGLDAWS